MGLALLACAAGCQPNTPPETAQAPPAAPQTMAHMDHMDHMAASPKSAGETETMRLHDALMGHMDSLMSESQRLRQQAARLDTHAVAGRRQAARLRRLTAALGAADAGMMGWMHDFQKTDTVRFSAHQYADFWADEQQKLRRLETQTRAALDSARRARQVR